MPSILTRRQRTYLRVLLYLALFVFANSAFLFLAHRRDEVTGFYQVMLLGHLVGGGLLLVLATVFVVWHLKRVRRLLHASAISSGTSLTIIAYLLFATGIFILSEANSRDHFWVFQSHRILALLAPALYGVHRLVSHFKPKARAVWTGAASFAGLVLLMLGVHATLLPPVLAAPSPPASGGDPFIPFVAKNYPDPSSPFWPSLTTTDSGRFFPARIITRGERGDFERIRADVERLGFAANTTIGSATCARCHPDIVEQWKDSAHRFSSFNNPFYRAPVEKMREDVGKKKSQWCAGCHDPAIMLAGNMTKDIDPLTPESQAGLTCLSCHAIESIHGIEGNGNYHIADEKPSPYLFDSASSGWRRAVADLLIKSKPAAHKRQMLKPFFRTAEFCSTCHKVSLDTPVNEYRWLRGQNEYDAHQDSGVSWNAARTFYLPPEPQSCQDCHMPYVEAPLGDVSSKNGKVRSHRFLAVNTALPYIRGDFDTIKRIEGFLKDGKLTVDVFAVRYPDGAMVRALDKASPTLVPGEKVIFDVVVRNKGVGHTFPGGTNDSNEAWIDFRITDPAGRVLYRSGAIDEKRYVDRKAHFYRVVMVRHDGTEATDRDPHTFHVPAFSRVIGPGTADVARYGITVPPDLAGQRIRIQARLQWRKVNRRYTEFVFKERTMKVPDLPHLKGQEIPDVPVTTIAQAEVMLDVRERRSLGAEVNDPETWMRFNDHGIANLLQGAYDVAEGSFFDVARLRPDLPDGYRNQARRWIQSARPEKALPFLEKVDEVAPRHPQGPYFWGRYFERIEEYERAAEAYESSVAVFPGDRDGWRRLGTVLFKLGRYKAALKTYLRVLEIDPEDLQAHKRRLDIYKLLGREKEAAEAAKAFHKYRRDDQAQQLLREFLQKNPEINEDAQRRHVHD
ncbi:MAG: tetratricopeptide repeat protein [Planctomycetota bacterium]|nr:tetratricopeptide repeat protein [Planctomycetota bacterium]